LDPKAIAEAAADGLAGLMDVSDVSIFYHNRNTDILETLAASGPLGSLFAAGIPLSASKDATRVIARRDMVMIPDMSKETGPEYETIRSHGITASLLLPIPVSEGVLGMIAINETQGPRQFADNEIQLVRNVAFQVGIALQNAYTFIEQVHIVDQLREVDRLKSQFLASMSHELRTPLNSIIGYAEVLLDGIDGELTGEMSEDVDAIHGSGKHLLSLINDILDLAKIEAGQMDLVCERVQPYDLIRETVSASKVLVKGRPVELVLNVPEDVPDVYADPLRVRQIVNNLVSNALKFTHEGSVVVSATQDTYHPDMLRISVKDSGIGINKENQALIFDRFRQADQTTTRKYGGTGLGLSITRQLIQMHGGDIWVESEPGQGSTFHFTLPFMPSDTE
jgi:signal transduction histidine kinase